MSTRRRSARIAAQAVPPTRTAASNTDSLARKPARKRTRKREASKQPAAKRTRTKKKVVKEKKAAKQKPRKGRGRQRSSGSAKVDEEKADAEELVAAPVPDSDMVRENLLFVFAHGAGQGQSSEWMTSWRKRLATFGVVHAFDYPYMQRGGGPPRAEKNVPYHTEQVQEAQRAYEKKHGRAPVTVLIGKSMGSRIGCHVAAQHPRLVHGVVCLGYPLVGGNGKSRDAVLLQLQTPTLLCQGERDRMSPGGPLMKVMKASRTARGGHGVLDLHSVVAGDHGLKLTKRQLKALGVASQQEAYDALLSDTIMSWIDTSVLSQAK